MQPTRDIPGDSRDCHRKRPAVPHPTRPPTGVGRAPRHVNAAVPRVGGWALLSRELVALGGAADDRRGGWF